jgi:hypothetical protein
MKRLFSAIILAVVLGFATLADAKLINNGGGLIYDTDLDITWYDYTYKGPTGKGASWQQAMDWVKTLTVGGTAPGSWTLPTSDTTCDAYKCIESQMGHLFYTELGLTRGTPVSSSNQYPFTKLQPSEYWSGTVYARYPDRAFIFYFYDGYQDIFIKDYVYFALAVHPGDVGAH